MEPDLSDLLAEVQARPPESLGVVDPGTFGADQVDYDVQPISATPMAFQPPLGDPGTIDTSVPADPNALPPAVSADTAPVAMQPPPASPGPLDASVPTLPDKDARDPSALTPSQKWLIGLSALHDAALDFDGRDTGDQFGKALEAQQKIAKERGDQAIADADLVRRRALVSADPSLTPLQRWYLGEMPSEDVGKTVAESLKGHQVAGGDTYVDPLAPHPSYMAPKVGVEGGVAYNLGPQGVTAKPLPPGYAAQAKASSDAAKAAAALAEANARVTEVAQPKFEYAGVDANGNPLGYNTKTFGWSAGPGPIQAKPIDHKDSVFEQKRLAYIDAGLGAQEAAMLAGSAALSPQQAEVKASQIAAAQVGPGGDPAAYKAAHDRALAAINSAGAPAAPSAPTAPTSPTHEPPLTAYAPADQKLIRAARVPQAQAELPRSVILYMMRAPEGAVQVNRANGARYVRHGTLISQVQ